LRHVGPLLEIGFGHGKTIGRAAALLWYPDREGSEFQHGVAPNELTATEHRDWFAGTPFHKHVPARIERIHLGSILILDAGTGKLPCYPSDPLSAGTAQWKKKRDAEPV
jgi:hypothetical protein